MLFFPIQCHFKKLSAKPFSQLAYIPVQNLSRPAHLTTGRHNFNYSRVSDEDEEMAGQSM